ncbi:unnamed protein product [Closterium sp. NIES-64]|nr:unnamed protein product [Closterium sp. NIES-64]
MGGGASEQVRWSEGGKDTSELGGNVKRDSKYTDSKFEFARRSDSGYQRSSSRTNGNNSEHDKSRRNESAESALHDYNEYNHNEYKNIPGWEWEEGEQEEEAAEAEFEAVARLWEEMEASGKVHPLSAPVGGLRWKQEAQERFPDLARTAGVFPYMGDVIEREELDTPYSCRLARTAGVFPYMGDVIEREELDTPYDYAPPPEIDSEVAYPYLCVFPPCLPAYMGDVIEREELDTPYGYAPPRVIDTESLAMIDRLQDLLTALRLFLPHALSTPLPAPPVTSKKEGGEGKGQGDWEQQEEGQKEEEWENERIHEDKPLRQRQQQQQQQPQEQQQQQRQERQEQQEQQSRARREEPVDIFALGLVEEGVRVQNPVVCVWGQDRWQQWLHLMGSAGGHLHLHHLYSETLVKAPGAHSLSMVPIPYPGAHSLSMVPIPYPDRRWITALWTILLAKSGRQAVAGMGLSDWWKRNLPEHEAEIRRNLPEEEGQDERGGVGRNGKLGAEKGKDEWRQGDEEEEEEEQSRINGGSSSSGGGKGIEFANQLKRARQFGQLTTFGKSLPKGGQSVVTNSLRKQEVITLALAAYAAEAKLAGERLSIPFSVRQRVASETGSTMGEIDMLLAKYEWFAEAANRMQALQDQGKPLPRSFAEIEQMMGGPWSPPKTGARSGASAGLAGGAGSAAAAPARNNPCPCGSGKKYKSAAAAAPARNSPSPGGSG